jgi:hypothetical protein
MDPLTFETVTRNPELVRALIEQAHRERAEAVHRLIVEPIKRLFSGRPAAQRRNLGAARKLVLR